jgi:hypothetical protein
MQTPTDRTRRRRAGFIRGGGVARGSGRESEDSGRESEDSGRESEDSGRESEGSGRESEGSGRISEGSGRESEGSETMIDRDKEKGRRGEQRRVKYYCPERTSHWSGRANDECNRTDMLAERRVSFWAGFAMMDIT